MRQRTRSQRLATIQSNTEIASDFTVADYLSRRSQLVPGAPRSDAWDAVRDAFRRRIEERFLGPVERLLERRAAARIVPGFAILTIDCLLIDTLQSFREGRISTGDGSSARSFSDFLSRARFSCFSSADRKSFIHNVRNGLLHNGETRRDWVVRTGRDQILTKMDGIRILDRTRFHGAIVQEFDEYLDELASGPDDTRERFLRRMDAICGLSVEPEVLYFAYGSNLLDAEIRKTVESARREGTAFLPGWRLTFTKHSRNRGGDAASITKCASRTVWGFLYRIAESKWPELEQRERGYRPETVTAYLADPRGDETWPVEAKTFVEERPCQHHCGPPAAYLDLVIEGAEEKGIPPDYIDELRTVATRER